jgi:hypothetical protein
MCTQLLYQVQSGKLNNLAVLLPSTTKFKLKFLQSFEQSEYKKLKLFHYTPRRPFGGEEV